MAVYVYPGVLNMKYKFVFSVILCRVPRETLFDWREPQQFVSSHDENNVFITFNSRDSTLTSPGRCVRCTAVHQPPLEGLSVVGKKLTETHHVSQHCLSLEGYILNTFPLHMRR